MKNKKHKNRKISIRKMIADQYPDTDLLFMDEKEFDEAIIGVCEGISVQHNPKVAYDYDKVIDANMKMGMSYDEAVEFFDFNQGGAYMGENTPVFITRIKQ